MNPDKVQQDRSYKDETVSSDSPLRPDSPTHYTTKEGRIFTVGALKNILNLLSDEVVIHLCFNEQEEGYAQVALTEAIAVGEHGQLYLWGEIEEEEEDVDENEDAVLDAEYVEVPPPGQQTKPPEFNPDIAELA